MKSRISILTRRGRSLLLRSMSDVTIGYLSNSSVLSWGNAFFLGVHLLSLLVSPSPNRVAFPRRWSCGTRALASAGRAPRARHCAARCEKSCLKSCVTSGESIDARASCLSRFAAVGEHCATVRGGVCGSLLLGPAKPSLGTRAVEDPYHASEHVCALHPSSYPKCLIASIMSLELFSRESLLLWPITDISLQHHHILNPKMHQSSNTSYSPSYPKSMTWRH
jgi:hypothetical protein